MIVEIRPGEGGEDSEEFAKELATKIIFWLAKDGYEAALDFDGAPRIFVAKVKDPAPG